MAAKKNRIGFVDNNLDNYHANVYLKALRGPLKGRGFRVAGCTGLREKPSRGWAEANDVPYFSDAAALNEAVDYYMVLAPSAPELHLELCQRVFPFGKATYVDKTFAPDLNTARRIFALADRYRVPMQTSSALRYTNVQEHVRAVGQKNVRHMVAWSGGRSFGEYAIHPVELVVSCMGAGVKRVMRRGSGNLSQLLLDCSGGRTAVVNVYVKSKTESAAAVTTTEGTAYLPVERASMFANSTVDILTLFQTGKPTINRKESLMIRRVLDVAGQKRALKGFVQA